MDPVTPTAAVRCPVDGCEYHPNVADAALAATLLSIHAQSLHVATPAPAPSYTTGATARVEKISRPTVDEGVSLEDWLYFEQRWREYKNATRITGLDLTYQLLECCNPDGLRKNLVRMHRDSLTTCKENELLTHIRRLAVRTENAMVARDVLSKMRQDRDEPVRAFSARLKGQARVCQFVAKCQCPHCPDHDVCVGTDYSDIVVRDQLVLGCADHDIKLDCLTEKGPGASLDEVMPFVEGKESGKLSLQQLAGGSEAAAPISSLRKQQRAVVKQRAPPTPLHTPPCTHCGQSGHGSGRDERSANCPAYDQACFKCGKQGHLGTVCRHPSTASPRYGQRRSNQPLQRETVTAVFQSLCGVTSTLPAEDAVVCNVKDFKLEHFNYDATRDTWVKKASAPQPTMSLHATHYPSDTRALGLPSSLRRPTKAALISVVADTGCQSCLAGPNLLRKLGLRECALNKTSLNMSAANRNRLDIIGAIALRLSISASHGSTETRQIVYICRDTSDFFLSRGACVALGIVSPNFPSVDHRSDTDVSACNAASESSMTAACECPRRQPPPPPPKELPPGQYLPHWTWRETLEAREDALRVRHMRAHERLSEHTRVLPPLAIGNCVRMQNLVGPYPTKWDRTGIVVEVRQFDQYVVRVDGSGRVTLRNRKHLRQYTPHVARASLVNSPSVVPLATTTPVAPAGL